MSCKKMMMQGDSYPIFFTIKCNGEYLDISEVNRIQFTVGSLVKMYIKNPIISDDPQVESETSEVTYDDENKKFSFPITQDESFAFESEQECQIRIKYEDSSIVGYKIGSINLQYSLTEEEI